MSPEGAVHAINVYLESLREQAKIAKAFALGKWVEGIEGLSHLPLHVRQTIEQFLWQANGGEPVDLANPDKAPMIVEALLFSLEERMGLHAD